MDFLRDGHKVGLYNEEKQGYVNRSFGISTLGLRVLAIGSPNKPHKGFERSIFIVKKTEVV